MNDPEQVTQKESRLIIFKTDSYSNITLFEDVALNLLTIIGHSLVVPGVIMADDVPAALDSLASAVAAETPAPSYPITQEEEEEGPAVSLRNRALPLLELLSTAASEEANVMWDWS